MAENSKIEWTDHTFNPWSGCTKVAEGCKFCYAEVNYSVKMRGVKWGPNGTRVLGVELLETKDGRVRVDELLKKRTPGERLQGLCSLPRVTASLKPTN